MLSRNFLYALFFCALSQAGHAANLDIGLSADVTSMDPHYHNVAPNNGMAKHIFDTLIRNDPKQKLIPGLATSWKAIDDTTWEMQLRKGVKWHDGSEFPADDVSLQFRNG